MIDYLTTLPYVYSDRIGAMGICAGRGYTTNAAINDRRVEAVGTVSAVNIGSMFGNGWDNNIKSADLIPVLENGSQAKPPDGKITEWTQPDQPIDPKKDHRIQFGAYGIAISPIDGSLWWSGIGVKDTQARAHRARAQPAAIKQSGSVCAAR